MLNISVNVSRLRRLIFLFCRVVCRGLHSTPELEAAAKDASKDMLSHDSIQAGNTAYAQWIGGAKGQV